MKILLDQNISFRLIGRIKTAFEEVVHVKSMGLADTVDHHIFMTIRRLGFSAIITQDEDFYHLLLEHGPPPKIIWLRTGNCSTAFMAEVILKNESLIQDFLMGEGADCLEIYG